MSQCGIEGHEVRLREFRLDLRGWTGSRASCLCDDAGMNLPLQERLGNMKHLSCKDDDGSSPISNLVRGPLSENINSFQPIHLLVLRSAELNHALSCGMFHVDLSENGMPVVRHHCTDRHLPSHHELQAQTDSSHGIQQHLQHGLRPQGGAYDIRHSLLVRHITSHCAHASLPSPLLCSLSAHSSRSPSSFLRLQRRVNQRSSASCTLTHHHDGSRHC